MKNKTVIVGILFIIFVVFSVVSSFLVYKNRRELYYIIATPLCTKPNSCVNIRSQRIEEARKRGSLIYEYRTPPRFDYKDSVTSFTIDIEEAFTEYRQGYDRKYKHFFNTRDIVNLVLVLSDSSYFNNQYWQTQFTTFYMNRKHRYRFIAFYSRDEQGRPYIPPMDTIVLHVGETNLYRNKLNKEKKPDVWAPSQFHFGDIVLIRKTEE